MNCAAPIGVRTDEELELTLCADTSEDLKTKDAQNLVHWVDKTFAHGVALWSEPYAKHIQRDEFKGGDRRIQWDLCRRVLIAEDYDSLAHWEAGFEQL